MVSLAVLTVFYALIGCVPMLSANRFTAFLILLAASVGPMTIYNVSWQANFSDLVNAKEQNPLPQGQFVFVIMKYLGQYNPCGRKP